MDSRRPSVIAIAFVFACGAMWCSINKASANEPHFAAGDPTSFQKPGSFRPVSFLRALFRLQPKDPAIKTPLTRAEKKLIAARKKFEKRENKLAEKIAKGFYKPVESGGLVRIEGAAHIEDYWYKPAEEGSWSGASFIGNRKLVGQLKHEYVTGDKAPINRDRLWQKVANRLELPAGSPMQLEVKTYDTDDDNTYNTDDVKPYRYDTYRSVSFLRVNKPPTAKPNE